MDPVAQLEILLKQETAPSDTAAIIIETVLGEGGYVPPPAGYLARVREICDKNNILLIADEVQCGFGRTGKMFAIEHWDVRPDILVMAKGIANGFPLSGIVSRKELMDLQKPGKQIDGQKGDSSTWVPCGVSTDPKTFCAVCKTC